ncbi:MAG: tetratricopeptide repeat protein [Rivularia sp. ALOHA_DT_140]|nr:tetratricopeptide repeat protein [Rivularia sp. ALOHA_DT_140]
MKLSRIIVLFLALSSIYFCTDNKAFAIQNYQKNISSELNCRNPLKKLLLAKTNKKKEICCYNGVCYECGRRGDSDISISSPKGTLLNQKPEISWSTVPNAKSYTVRLEDSRGILWEREVNSTKLAYPENETPLKRSKFYELKIKAYNSQGETISSGKTSIRVISEDKAIELQLTDKTVIETAQLYEEKNLITEAVNILEKAVKNKSQNPQFYVMLGNLYWQRIGNTDKADNYYQQALTIAKNTNNQNAQAEAEKGLGKVYLAQGNIEQGISLLKKAYNYYEIYKNQEFYGQIPLSLGQVYQILEQKEETIRWYQKAKTAYEKLNSEKPQKQIEKRLKWIEKQLMELSK